MSPSSSRVATRDVLTTGISSPGRTMVGLTRLSKAVLGQANNSDNLLPLKRNGTPARNKTRLKVLPGNVHDP